jgi:hypothetical protein
MIPFTSLFSTRRMAAVGASLPLPPDLAKVPDRSDSSHSTVAAATALHAPKPPYPKCSICAWVLAISGMSTDGGKSSKTLLSTA